MKTETRTLEYEVPYGYEWADPKLPCNGCANAASSFPYPGFSSGENACTDCLRSPHNSDRDPATLIDNICSLERLTLLRDLVSQTEREGLDKLEQFIERGTCAECQQAFDYLCPKCREMMQ